MDDEELKSQFKTVERIFIILPLMRCEDLEKIQRSLELINDEVELAKEAENHKMQKRFIQMMQMAEETRDMVE